MSHTITVFYISNNIIVVVTACFRRVSCMSGTTV